MAIWGFFVISGIDNVVKPYLISRGSQMPFVLVFLGVIGGVISFGFLGVFLGPVLLAVGFTLLLAWNSGERIEGEGPQATHAHALAVAAVPAPGDPPRPGAT
jgi:predicted PurR-regulated permease PerM